MTTIQISKKLGTEDVELGGPRSGNYGWRN